MAAGRRCPSNAVRRCRRDARRGSDGGRFVAYRVDPTVGLGALPWDWTTPTPATPPDISPDDHRAASWTSAPVGDALLITGSPAVTVRLTSDRPDVPLRAWLSDVRPDGSSTLICQGWVRATHVLGRTPAGRQPGRCPRAARAHVLSPRRRPPAPRLRRRFAFPGPRAGAGPGDLPDRGRAGWDTPGARRSSRPMGRLPFRHAGRRASREARRRSSSQASRHSVERDLDDRDARYRQSRRMAFALEAGGDVDVGHDLLGTRGARRAGRDAARIDQVWRIVGRSPAVEVRIRTWQTFDEQDASVEIDVDGRRFFERTWHQRFDDYPWRIRR